jgi:hypothetical protein
MTNRPFSDPRAQPLEHPYGVKSEEMRPRRPKPGEKPVFRPQPGVRPAQFEGKRPPLYRPITKEAWDKLLAYYMVDPGNKKGASIAAGVDWRTARRAWETGWNRRDKGWDPRPMQDIVAESQEIRDEVKRKADAERVKEEWNERIRAEEAKQEVAKKQVEARQIEEETSRLSIAALRLARSDIVSGLGALAQLTSGITKLAERVNETLKTGKDANGKPFIVSVPDTLTIIQKYASAVGQLVNDVNTVTGIDRVKANLPTSIVGIDVSGVTLADAENQIALAQDILIRAKQLGLASRAPHELGDGRDPH